MSEALAISGLSGGYGEQTVLHRIDLVLAVGSLTALIGPNGHGKSTLLRAISGLLPRVSGKIMLFGQSIERLPAHRRARAGVAHIPQGDLLFKEMSVEENLRTGGFFRSKSDFARALDEVYGLFPRLAERRHQRAASLSGGERRMVGIGRGLMQDGRLLMIDEPSLGLAPAVIDQIYASLGKIAASGRTILLVEENPARIIGLASQIVLLDDGRFVWTGDAADMQANRSLFETYLGGVAT
jgi:branched-chain amino acid transport system ATP-binding protein